MYRKVERDLGARRVSPRVEACLLASRELGGEGCCRDDCREERGEESGEAHDDRQHYRAAERKYKDAQQQRSRAQWSGWIGARKEFNVGDNQGHGHVDTRFVLWDILFWTHLRKQLTPRNGLVISASAFVVILINLSHLISIPLAATMEEDPFNAAQRDILALLSSTRPLLSSYLRIRSTSSTHTSPELTEAREELEAALSDLSTDLQDLVDSVRAVEGDPYKYGLDVDEVARRRGLVADVTNEVEGMRAQVLETVDSRTAPGGAGGLPDPEAFARDDDDDAINNGYGDDAYQEFEQQRQQEMLAEQDEALDGVFRTVGNIRAQADEMGRELEEQGIILDHVDNLADRVGGKLQSGIKKIEWVVRNNEGERVIFIWLVFFSILLTGYLPIDRWSGCCIGVLIFVLILLLVLVLIV